MGLKLHQVKALWDSCSAEIPEDQKFRRNRSMLFKMAAIFGKRKFFLKIGMATLQRYPVGEKFR